MTSATDQRELNTTTEQRDLDAAPAHIADLRNILWRYGDLNWRRGNSRGNQARQEALEAAASKEEETLLAALARVPAPEDALPPPTLERQLANALHTCLRFLQWVLPSAQEQEEDIRRQYGYLQYLCYLALRRYDVADRPEVAEGSPDWLFSLHDLERLLGDEALAGALSSIAGEAALALHEQGVTTWDEGGPLADTLLAIIDRCQTAVPALIPPRWPSKKGPTA